MTWARFAWKSKVRPLTSSISPGLSPPSDVTCSSTVLLSLLGSLADLEQLRTTIAEAGAQVEIDHVGEQLKMEVFALFSRSDGDKDAIELPVDR